MQRLQGSGATRLSAVALPSLPAKPETPFTKNAIALSTGVTLEYVERGDRDGIPVVLLHGVTDSWRSFEGVLAHLPASIRAFAISQRGHGDSDKPASGYSTTGFAADVAAFLDAVDLRSAVVVGHSMGTTNALRFAIDYPRRVRGLFCAGTFASYRHNPVITDFCESAIATLSDPIDPSFARAFQQSTLAQAVPSDLLEMAVRESLHVPAAIWRAAFDGMREDACLRDLDRIAVPTLLLWGDRDALVPRADQDALTHAIAGARLSVYRGAGHALHWEEPERFARDLTAFVESCAQTSVHRIAD